MERTLGVNHTLLRDIRTNPDFQLLVSQMTKQLFVQYVPDVINAMKDQAMMGNVRAAELFLQWVADYNVENPGELNRPLGASEEEVQAVILKIRRKKI